MCSICEMLMEIISLNTLTPPSPIKGEEKEEMVSPLKGEEFFISIQFPEESELKRWRAHMRHSPASRGATEPPGHRTCAS